MNWLFDDQVHCGTHGTVPLIIILVLAMIYVGLPFTTFGK
jgi:hypothetical protein